MLYYKTYTYIFLNHFYNKKQIFNGALNKLFFFFSLYNVNIFNEFENEIFNSNLIAKSTVHVICLGERLIACPIITAYFEHK